MLPALGDARGSCSSACMGIHHLGCCAPAIPAGQYELFSSKNFSSGEFSWPSLEEKSTFRVLYLLYYMRATVFQKKCLLDFKTNEKKKHTMAA